VFPRQSVSCYENALVEGAVPGAQRTLIELWLVTVEFNENLK
jgi:hypothetical protein